MVDDPLVIVADKPVLSASAELHLVQIGAGGAIGAGDRSADELSAVVVQGMKRCFAAAHKLVLIPQNKNRLPHLFERHAAEGVEIFVRNLRSAVRQPLALPKRG